MLVSGEADFKANLPPRYAGRKRAIGSRRDPPKKRPEHPAALPIHEMAYLPVQPVLSLVEHNRLGTFDRVGIDFLATN
jgi:hypothetical protein